MQTTRADANETNMIVMSSLVLKPLISLQRKAVDHKVVAVPNLEN